MHPLYQWEYYDNKFYNLEWTVTPQTTQVLFNYEGCLTLQTCESYIIVTINGII